LHTLGSGELRQDGAIICIGLYDGKDAVVVRPDDPRLADWLASDEDKIFHNGIYDLAWLIIGYGFKVGGRWHDTMTREGLINEYVALDLDSCCKRHRIKGKNFDDTLEAWFESKKKQWGLRGSVWDNIDVVSAFPDGWQALEKYNKQDCIATYNLFMSQEPRLRDVQEIYNLECELYPLWIDMKRTGIRIDELRLERLHHEVNRLVALQEQQLWNEYQLNGEIIASSKKMGIAMHRLGIHSPNKTKTGADSWDVKSLPIIDHPVVPLIMNYKNLSYLAGNKSLGNIERCIVNGRIHPTFSPTKRDEGGTLNGRLSCKSPNLQNQPSREEAYGEMAWGPAIRSIFIPEEGMMLGAPDYSQIEVKVMSHFAVGQYADDYRKLCSDPNIDLHAVTMERTKIKSRYICKRISFGIPYGMAAKKLVQLDYPVFKKVATEAGVDDVWEYGRTMYNQYVSGFPVLTDLVKHIENTVRAQGYITSVGGRRHHAPKPVQNQWGQWGIPYYQCVAHVISGSASDILKKGLRDAYVGGVFNTLPMHLTVHDENVVSVPFNNEGVEAMQELIKCMEGAYQDRMKVPTGTSTEVGPHWGYWKKDIYKEMMEGIFDPGAFKRVYAPQVKRSWWCIQNGYIGLDGELDYLD
jgi:DNA polymerase I-like protein with 3'-5' exonuclease and polymerase domains